MAVENSSTEVSNVISNDVEATIPEHLLPLDPRGLRAFPAELRDAIFKSYFPDSLNIKLRGRREDDLLVALHEHDDLLHEEAAVVCYSTALVRVCGAWEKNRGQGYSWLDLTVEEFELRAHADPDSPRSSRSPSPSPQISASGLEWLAPVYECYYLRRPRSPTPSPQRLLPSESEVSGPSTIRSSNDNHSDHETTLDSNLSLVKNLEISQPISADSMPFPPSERDHNVRYYNVTLSQKDLSIGRYLDSFANVTNLSLCLLSNLLFNHGCRSPKDDWEEFPSVHGVIDSVNLGYKLVCPLITTLKKLTKLTIVLRIDSIVVEELDDVVEDTDDEYPLIDEGLRLAFLPFQVTYFEDYTLEIVKAALGVSPKQDTVQTCSIADEIEEIVYHFYDDGNTVMSHGYEVLHDVVWFWESEDGKPLVWDMDKAVEKTIALGVEVVRAEDMDTPVDG